MDVGEALEHRYGPLPAWGWAALAIVVVGGVVVIRRLRSGGDGGTSGSGLTATVPTGGVATSGAPGQGAPAGTDYNLDNQTLAAVEKEIADASKAASDQTAQQLVDLQKSLIDYGNLHWLGSGSVGGGGGTGGSASTVSTSSNSTSRMAYSGDVQNTPFAGLANVFLRSDTPTGLSTEGWTSDQVAQLQHAVQAGYITPTTNYSGPQRPVG